ncbi:unnamed protein product [Urochloa humidicola]
MAEAAAWMVLVRQQVEEALGRCDNARGLLAGVHGLLDSAHSVAPALARDRARRAAGMVTEASVDLAAAASLSRAALLVALRGGGARGPAAAPPPPLSINDVPDEGLRTALAQLQEAADSAGSACGFACLSRAHLVGVLLLLNHPHPLPGGGDGVVGVKLRDARDELANARRYAQGSGQMVNATIAALML